MKHNQHLVFTRLLCCLDYCLDCFIRSYFHMCYYGLSLTAYAPNVTLLLSLSHHQGQKAATCLFITCPRSSEMQNSCKCSCLLATSSLPKSLWTERPIRANVLVSQKSTVKREKKKKVSKAMHRCSLAPSHMRDAAIERGDCGVKRWTL